MVHRGTRRDIAVRGGCGRDASCNVPRGTLQLRRLGMVEAGAEGGAPDTGSRGGKARAVTRNLARGRRISRCPTATARQRELWRVESSEGERGSAGDSPALPLEPFLPRI